MLKMRSLDDLTTGRVAKYLPSPISVLDLQPLKDRTVIVSKTQADLWQIRDLLPFTQVWEADTFLDTYLDGKLTKALWAEKNGEGTQYAEYRDTLSQKALRASTRYVEEEEAGKPVLFTQESDSTLCYLRSLWSARNPLKDFPLVDQD